jgi:IclR family acetate operon transcriptional repressor
MEAPDVAERDGRFMTDETRSEARPGGVQSIDRAVAILRCFSGTTPTLGVTEIARATGLTTSTTHRLLEAMHTNRLVRQTADRRYALGSLVVQLVRGGGIPATLHDAASGQMHALRDSAEETVGLHILLRTLEREVVEQVESHLPLRRTYTEIGVPIPLPHGAPGKAMLAFLPFDVQVAALSKSIEPVTPTTITDPETMRGQLIDIRAVGYALSFAERTHGIRSVAAPIFDHTDTVVGALSLSGPEIRMTKPRMRALGEEIKVAAWSVSETLGATPEGRDRCLEKASAPAR